LTDNCLKERGFWTNIEHPELKTSITYPKEFVRSSEVDCSTKFRAPLIGEHNEEVYKEIGISDKELSSLKDKGII
jgi:formyl-CoA transferase